MPSRRLMKIRTPIASSSAMTCWLSVGCARKSRSEARVKLAVSATATMYFKSLNSRWSDTALTPALEGFWSETHRAYFGGKQGQNQSHLKNQECQSGTSRYPVWRSIPEAAIDQTNGAIGAKSWTTALDHGRLEEVSDFCP